MKQLFPINQKALRIELEAAAQADVVALQEDGASAPPARTPHSLIGCSISFFPGWEVDSSGGTA